MRRNEVFKQPHLKCSDIVVLKEMTHCKFCQLRNTEEEQEGIRRHCLLCQRTVTV